MNDSQELWRWTATDLAHGIKTRQISSVEAVLSCLARLSAVNPAVNAVVSVQRDDALKAAEEADLAVARGEPLGVLHGVPVTTKINVDQAGLPTTNGVVAFADKIAVSDSAPVRNLRNAGAVILGRTNTPAFSMRWFTDNDLHGRTLNPWCKEVTPGGSSGGAAVSVATGMVPIAHGNDGGGSIRYPAYCTGTVGLRPSFGRIPSYNESAVVERPLAMQFVSVQGPIARNVADVRLALTALAVGDPRDPWWVPAPLAGTQAGDGLQVAVCTDPTGAGISADVEAHIRLAAMHLTDAGYRTEDADPPDVGACAVAWNDFAQGEGILTVGPQVARFGDYLAKRSFELMANRTPRHSLESHIALAASRSTYLRRWQLFMERYPLILCPVALEQALPYGVDVESDESVDRLYRSHTFLFATAFLGLPSVSIPTGLVNGIPMGVQVIGGRFREDLVLTAAEAIEHRVAPLTPTGIHW